MSFAGRGRIVIGLMGLGLTVLFSVLIGPLCR